MWCRPCWSISALSIFDSDFRRSLRQSYTRCSPPAWRHCLVSRLEVLLQPYLGFQPPIHGCSPGVVVALSEGLHHASTR